jgi:hypothetical protein
MNAVEIDRALLRRHIRAIEAVLPIRFLRRLRRGSVGHLKSADAFALELLAEKRDGLTLFDLAQAEIDLGERLGRTVGIVLVSRSPEGEPKPLPPWATSAETFRWRTAYRRPMAYSHHRAGR